MNTVMKLQGMEGKPLNKDDLEMLEKEWQEKERLKKEVNRLEKELKEAKKASYFGKTGIEQPPKIPNKLYQVDESTINIIGEKSFYLHASGDTLSVIELNSENEIK